MQTIEKEHWFHLSSLQGHIAMWAVRQSPYHNPSIGIILDEFRRLVKDQFDENDMAKMSRAQLRTTIGFLDLIPEFRKLNERKNGNKAPFQFVSSYDGKRDPDDDFIDLDALKMNAVRSLWKELEDET